MGVSKRLFEEERELQSSVLSIGELEDRMVEFERKWQIAAEELYALLCKELSDGTITEKGLDLLQELQNEVDSDAAAQAQEDSSWME